MNLSPTMEVVEKLRMAKAHVKLLGEHRERMHEKYMQASVDYEAATEAYHKMLAEFDKMLGEGIL